MTRLSSVDQAISVIEELESARSNAVRILKPIFLNIAKSRFPLDSEVDMQRKGLRIISGKSYGLRNGKVVNHSVDNINLSNPELTDFGVRVQLRNSSGALTEHKITGWQSIVDVFSGVDEREQLIKAIKQSA